MEKEKINDGGAAFPMVDSSTGAFQCGMSLRDYFAAKAMQGFLSGYGVDYSKNPLELFAIDAYKMADVMLKQREK